MKPVAEGERQVINIFEAEFEPFISDRGKTDGYFLQLDRSKGAGNGFYIYKMEPGYTTIPHRHRGIEEFLILSGDLTDNDGTVYREGDMVSMAAGTEHCSYSEKGCVIAVYSESLETTV
jgi:quercetin dioxygenase-like cupin family protein